MRCEVCGRNIFGKSYKAIIEGAKLTVCGKCVKHGTIVWEKRKPEPIMSKTRSTTRFPPLKARSKKPPQAAVEGTLELVESFDAKIRQAREKLALSHNDLGRKISEKVSVLKKIEKGKMTPDNRLATKLEHVLRVKLLVPVSEEKVPKVKIPKSASPELTLGDLIQLDKKKAEERTQRKQS